MADLELPAESTPPTRYASAILPPPRQMHAKDWLIRAALWLGVAAGFIAMLQLDVPLMQWRYRHIPDEVGGWNRQVLMGLRDFGQVLPIVVALLIIHRMDRRRWYIIAAVVLAQSLASIGYNTGKY